MNRNNCDDPKEPRLVAVLETRDAGLIAVAKSLLEEAGLEYWTEGEPLQTTMPLMDLVLFKVRSEDADQARVLLQERE